MSENTTPDNNTTEDLEIIDDGVLTKEEQALKKATVKKKANAKKRRKRGVYSFLTLKNVLIGIGALAVITVGTVVLVNNKSRDNALSVSTQGTVNVETITETIPEGIVEDGILGSSVIGHIVEAGRSVEEAYKARPETVELTDENRNDFVKITECVIDSGRISLKGISDGIPQSDDKYYYLFEHAVYEDSVPEGAEPISKIYKNSETNLTCSLSDGQGATRLYKQFAIGVKVDGEYQIISSSSFITNPEAVCKYSNVYMTPKTKKGILVDYTKYKSGQLQDLGVGQVAINFRIEDFLGPTTNALYPTVHYSYNGKTYAFNGAMLSGFDETVRYLTEQGISITAILLNTYSSAYIDMIHPNSRSAGVCNYYMFNAANQAGVDYLSAVGSFFADRYSGSKHGRISNWVIANEINARKEWNYMAYTDVDTYTKEYAKGFRVLYTAIKSVSGSARVMISLDQQWDRNLKNNPDYDGRDVLECFNKYIGAHGNIDWGLAYHPYNVPLTSCSTWASSKYISHSADSSMISMANIEVLLNYMKQDAFLRTDGSHRDIMITELGYTSSGSGGEAYQAAALAYAFYKINHYDDIDALLLNRQTDDATELAQGLATGITSLGGGKKMSYDVFKYMDTSEFESHCEFAKSIIGISSWSQIMR